MNETSSAHPVPGATVLNPYGQMALDHWAKWRPNQLSQIPDPQTFFSRLGLDVEAQIDQVAADLAGDDPGGEGYLEKVGRLRMARFTAESQVLRELVLLPPEPGHPDHDPEDDPNNQPSRFPADALWEPIEGMTPEHPNYHDLDDSPFLRKVPSPTTDSAQPPTDQRPT